ncbi:MAG: hypothetical protein N3A38_08370 [Planctomycetota bacterium]|nr:hypothetical protein [Planctomycetota bacterium]
MATGARNPSRKSGEWAVGSGKKGPGGEKRPFIRRFLAPILIATAALAYGAISYLRPGLLSGGGGDSADSAGPLAPLPRAVQPPPDGRYDRLPLPPGPAAAAALTPSDDGKRRPVVAVSSKEEAAAKVREMLEAFKGNDRARQVEAVETVGSLAASGDVARDALVGAIPDAPPALLNEIIEQAEKRGWKEAVPPLARRVRLDGTRTGRKAFFALGRFGTPEARGTLRALAADPSSPAGALAWHALTLCADGDDLEPALAVMDGPPSPAQEWAAEVVGRLCAAPACRERVEKFLSERVSVTGEKEKMKSCGMLLAKLPADDFFRFAEVLAAHRDGEVRAAALAAIGRSRAGGAKLTMALLNDPDPTVRTSCMVALKSEPRFEAIPALVKIMAADRNYADLARGALEAAFGLDLGGHPSAWKLFIESGAREGDPGRRKAFEEAQAKRLAEARKAGPDGDADNR